MAKNGASFWARGPGITIIVLVAVVVATAAGAFAFLHILTHPARNTRMLDPEEVLLRAEEIELRASDGVPLSGWFVKGRPDRAVIILCHDLGAARSSLLNSAAALNRAGFPLFLLDFRGHGRSGGSGSSLGIDERLDILAVVDFLSGRPATVNDRFGVWGTGMGAYAAALASIDNAKISALALDSIYPDIESELDRLALRGAPQAARPALRLLRLFYNPYFRFRLARYSVRRLLPRLAGRDLVFIAGSDDAARLEQEKLLYAQLPDDPSGEKNFLEMGASSASGLYAEDKKRYDDALVDFFTTYLADAGHRAGDAVEGGLQVLEK